MTKLDENLKNELLSLAETLNAFKSEAVQLKIAEKLLGYIIADENQQSYEDQEYEKILNSRRAKRINGARINQETVPRERKSTGATKAMYHLLDTDFFDQPKSISAIAYRYNQEFDQEFKTSEISGILLKSVKEKVLKREKNIENKRYEYVKV